MWQALRELRGNSRLLDSARIAVRLTEDTDTAMLKAQSGNSEAIIGLDDITLLGNGIRMPFD